LQEAPVAEDEKLLVNLHPMHEQVLANLELLKAATQGDPVIKLAIEVLTKVDLDLKRIGCWHMGVYVTFKK
jgi:hypothetical protein